MKIVKISFLIMAVCLINACTVLENNSAAQLGSISYYLPKTVVDLEVKAEKRLTATKQLKPADAGLFIDGNGRTVTIGAPKVAYVITEINVSSRVVADPAHQYYFSYQPNIFSNDEVNVELTKDNLLKRIKVVSEDQSGQFVVKIGELAKEITKLGAVGSTRSNEFVTSVETISIKTSFDPLASASILAAQTLVNNRLAMVPAGATLINPNGITIGFVNPFAGRPAVAKAANANLPGIKYRPMVPVELSVQSNEIAKSIMVSIPGQNIYNLDVRRAAFVKKVTEIEFQDGVLTKFYVNKPSEAVGFIQVPIDLAKTIVAIPSELIQLKINTAGKQKELVDAQKSLAEAEENLKEFLQSISEEGDSTDPF